MRKLSNWKLPKWAVVIAAAFLFLPLAVDWAQPGEGPRLAAVWLDGGPMGTTGSPGTEWLFPIWGWLVVRVGKDVAALGWLSVCAGLICVWLVAMIVGTILGAAVRHANGVGVKDENEFPFVESAAMLLAGFAFAFTPGFLVAATHVSPLMVGLVPPLAAVALVAGVVCQRPRTGTKIDRLKKGKGRLVLAAGLIVYSAFELVLARRFVWVLAFPAVAVWVSVGVLPALVIAWCVRKRWIVGTKAQLGAFGVWTTAILVLGVMNVTMGTLGEGRAANRLVAQVIANAEAGGRIALVSDGMMDELFYFMLPEKMKLITLAKDRDPAYGRELSAWVRDEVEKRGGGGQRNAEDLVFAAELGPRALIDEWTKLDKAGFGTLVASTENFFPTSADWEVACGELKGMRPNEPLDGPLRHFLAVCGNGLGCTLIERGDLKSAWKVFKAIVERVEPKNYAAVLNLLGMVERGYTAPKDDVSRFAHSRRFIEQGLKDWTHVVHAARSGGRLYVDLAEVAKFERERREQEAKRELSPEAQTFVAAVAASRQDPQRGRVAQEAIHRAIRTGKVRADRIGGELIALDLALGDVENAEKDALNVLWLDRHDPTANAALGALAGMRGDYERAERYLQRAIATGKASAAAKNDLAYVLCRQGRLVEAEAFARESVKQYDGHWLLRETLAAILIRRGKLAEGEDELTKAEELAEKAGMPKGKVASFAIDRARLLKAKGDTGRFRMAIRVLRNRKDLTAEQTAEIGEMDW